jgi:glycerol kinase
VGYWSGKEEIAKQWLNDHTFENEMAELESNELYAGWQKAVTATRTFK